MSLSDTIYALSSAPGKAGVAVMRVSGERAAQTLLTLTGTKTLPEPRQLRYVTLKNPPSFPRPASPEATPGLDHSSAVALAKAEKRESSPKGEKILDPRPRGDEENEIDRAMAVFFESPHSFTGEDVAEFHVHGGRAVVQALCAALSAQGLRMAEPGEFTRRAFLNGKLDLAEAEGLADLINAETEAQRKQALKQMGGALSKIYETWREKLTRILAHVEADIDFPDEDLPPNLLAARVGEIENLAQEIENHLNDARRGERLREGFYVAILGAPNAGKSSLINVLARREAAIVSARAGTTRDVVEAHLDLAGYPVILADTAGLRESADEIEQEGIRRALARAESADLKIVLFDASETPDEKSLALVDEKAIAVFSKIDLGFEGSKVRGFEGVKLPANPRTHAPAHLISAKTGEGIPELLAALTARLKAWTENSGPAPLTRQRHREALTTALESLRKARQNAQNRAPYEITAEDLRASITALGRLTGRVNVEDLLDVIFRDFCVGK